MTTPLNRLFEQTYHISQREAVGEVTVPYLGRFCFFGGAVQFWLQMSLALSLTCLANALAAIVLFFFIVRRRGSTASLLLGWGVVIPLSWYLPYQFLPLLKIENVAIVFGFLAFPTYIPFRTMEAMYKTSPAFAEKSLWSYISYVALPIPLDFNSKTGQLLPISSSEIWTKAKQALLTFIITVVIFSIMEPTNYAPFPQRRPVASVVDTFHWGNILNNYLVAYIASVMLESGSLVFQIAIGVLTGYSALQFNDRPLLASSSPSEFWASRWNKQVQGVLQRGVYLPLRKGLIPKAAAVFGTFLASGILHEYTLAMVRSAVKKDGYIYNPRLGGQLLFFLWNFFVILVENLLCGNNLLPAWIGKLPKPLKTALVLLTVLPISHWFTDEWIAAGFFSGVAQGFPRVVWME